MKIDSATAKIIGLEETELKILSAIEKDKLTIADISLVTKIPRTSLYYILPKLLERKFVSNTKLKKKTYWHKNSDAEIKNVLQNALDKLTNQTQGNFVKTISKEAEITFFHGAENMANFWEILANSPKNIRVYGIQPGPSILELIPKSNIGAIVKFNQLVKKNKYIMEGVVHENYIDAMGKIMKPTEYKELLKSFGGRATDYAKLPDQYMSDICSEIYLFDNKIGLLNWREEFAVVIGNEDVYKLLLEMFKSTKYMLDKYDQNEKIARRLVNL